MFREVARVKQALDRETCIRILKEEKRGVLAVQGDDGYPYAMPLNHWYCEEDGKLYFHSGRNGHRTDSIRRSDKASFCVMNQGTQEAGNWWLDFESVIVFGRIEIIEDHERALDISRRLSYKFTEDEGYIQYEIEHSGPGVMVFALTPEHITGKLVHER
ncbi:MAG: pyridoxamine 5'-phosphate oxidase family protein [Oscillospiraceae bacterium]|nr:pyridoxamine 5'-phosphate oxidase family protein [Oscillospiraceae bacterium]